MFFFSSRRRHTRYWRDWSSDVCSSDLVSHHTSAFRRRLSVVIPGLAFGRPGMTVSGEDRKSTRLNSSHANISYAVFCLKTKKHTSELQSRQYLVCRLLLEKKKED